MPSERRSVSSAVFAAVAAAALGAAACAGTLDDPERFRDAGSPKSDAATSADATPDSSGGCGSVEETILHANCTNSGCHTASGSAGSLDLESADVLGRLSNKSATGGTGVLITPGDPDASVLYAKLTATPPFGTRMPFGGSLDDASIACVREWIAASK
jgi:hypothetical protein